MSERPQPYTPRTDPNSSSSTLVNQAASTTPTPMSSIDTPGGAPSVHTPFSPNFDPNSSGPLAQTPLAFRPGVHTLVEGAYPAPDQGAYAGAGQTEPAWSQRLSVSFSHIAEQIAEASRALAVAGAPASSAPGAAGEVVGALAARLEAIERNQELMGAQLQAVQDRLAQLSVNGAARPRGEKGQGDVEEISEYDGEFKTSTEIAIEELQKQVQGVVETIRLDQARLYARLHNAAVTANKHLIKAPVLANGKPPPNFPSTKGEFEHITKERYEALLKGYNLPVTGDTNAKREALREFIGLTPPV
ncbi:hypothetical protein TRAPUB_11354 [Trametes pubescens]|uniref:Uncharacterized protein n=1 Tax=Trametes pubescens TaxID=154538 RepID=A0A1M2VX54_TRAPU|nr:hypothetical protein TRAPUB_11354 [Trametes pubescens]